MQIGSWVKINTKSCELTCANGHEGGHRAMDGRVGRLIGDSKSLCLDCKRKIAKLSKHCPDCDYVINLLTWLEQTQHYYSVEFSDGGGNFVEEWEFSIDELELIGDGSLSSVIEIAQAENLCVPA